MMRREPVTTFNLSFLDVLCCALGAVVMLLLVSSLRHEEAQTRLRLLADDLEGRLRDERQRATDAAEQLAAERQARELAQREAQDLERRRLAEQQQARADLEREGERVRSAQASAAAAQASAAAAERRATAAERRGADAAEELERLRGRAARLVALRGELRNVVFLVDTSGSLALGDDAGPRFAAYKELLQAWVLTLPMDRLAIVRFHTNVETPPTWGPALLEATPGNRQRAAEWIATFEADGGTNTMGALRLALAELADADTIVLFSDGQPNDRENRSVKVDPQTEEERRHAVEACDWVLAEVATLNPAGDKRRAINTVALGEYLNRTYGEFLRRLARDNDGAFIGL